jgi:lipopolysaccharide/colanic/teichoic acid biosynthesis glycosyltransferase
MQQCAIENSEDDLGNAKKRHQKTLKLTPYYYELTEDQYNKQLERYYFQLENFKPVFKNSLYPVFIKRIIDIFISLVGCIITFPINVMLAICTYFDVGRPIIFRQKRIGKDCKIFTLYKFRNMTNAKDENGELLPPEKRVTKFGKFVRKTSLDELLQLWNILAGQMSIIGPRPLPTYYLPRYNNKQITRHLVRPGLECPTLSDEYDNTVWEDRFQNDIEYISCMSFKIDVRMVVKVAKLLVNKKNNKLRSNGSIEEFEATDNSSKLRMGG